jgi:hypothetical protein
MGGTMAEPVTITVRAGHPDFFDLPWERSITTWEGERMVDLPRGISRHEVRFVCYPEGTYAIKELPLEPARRDYTILRTLEDAGGPAVVPVGLVERLNADPQAEEAAALITRYLDYSFSYRELVSGGGFGPRRTHMLDAFANLLVELHLLGCFWGDCSLSNVLYRYDAETIRAVMVDAETASIYPTLSQGQRLRDLELMEENVAGEMMDIAAETGLDLDEADVGLGGDIDGRYRGLWEELTSMKTISVGERFRITERVRGLNDLGFEVEEINLLPTDDGHRLQFKTRVGGRHFHASRLKELTGIDATERQARQILSDLHYYQMRHGADGTSAREVLAVQWRVGVFEPYLQRITALEGILDPVQGYCDFLHHRYLLSAREQRDVGNQVAFQDWAASGRPGYPVKS